MPYIYRDTFFHNDDEHRRSKADKSQTQYMTLEQAQPFPDWPRQNIYKFGERLQFCLSLSFATFCLFNVAMEHQQSQILG